MTSVNPFLLVFSKRDGGEDLWIQFNYERLSNICYKCGSINHITEKCNFESPAFITTSVGISAKVYGPWLKAENSGGLLFVNWEEEDDGQRFNTYMMVKTNVKNGNPNVSNLMKDMQSSIIEHGQGKTEGREAIHAYTKKEIVSTIEMS